MFERFFCKIVGRLVYHSDTLFSVVQDNPRIMLFFVLILVFVSLGFFFLPRSPHLWTLFSIILYISSSITTAESSPGNEPAADASGSGTEALELGRAALEERLREFLVLHSGKRSPQQKVFDSLKSELKLGSATPADLTQIALIIEQLNKSHFASPSEAASQVVMDYSVYYEATYQKSLFL
jgi:hypothetical protein